MRKLSAWILGHPLLCVLVVAIATAAFAPGINQLFFDTSGNMLVQKDAPDRAFYDETVDTFGDDLILSIVIKADDIFTIPVLASIERMTADAETLNGVRRVVSLSTVSDIRGQDGLLETDYLLPFVPEEEAETAEIRKNALGSDIFRGEVISRDGKASAVNLFVSNDPSDPDYDTRLVDAVHEIVEREQAALGDQVEIYQTGIPDMKVGMIRSIKRDMATLLPISFLVVFATLFLLYRSIGSVVVPLVTGSISVVITLGFMGFTGIPFNPITSIIPILLMVIGATEDIHLLSEHESSLGATNDRRAATRTMMAKGGLAAFLTALTTFFGFVTIIGNSIPVLRQFGIAASFGIAVNFAVTILLVPHLLTFLPAKRRPSKDAASLAESGFLSRLARSVAAIGRHHRMAVVVISSLVAALCVLAIQRIAINTDYVGFFRKSAPVRQAFDDISANLAGANSFYIVVETGRADGMKDPAVLEQISGLADFLTERTDKVSGFPFLIRKAHQEMNDGDPAFDKIPDTPELVAQYSILLNQDDLDRFVASDFSKTCLLVRTKTGGSRYLRQLVEEIETYAAENFPRDLETTATGELILVAGASDEIARGIIDSLVLLLVAVVIVITVLFWSLKAGLLALIPNLLPVVVNFAAMGLLTFELGPGTFPVAMIAFGIAVDDTIHFMVRYFHELKTSKSDADAVEISVVKEFRPVLASTVALVAGFLVLVFSEFGSTAQFGLLAAISLAAALICDLFLTPVVFRIAPLISIWDYLLLKISKDGLQKSRLFEGLRTSEIKKVALAGDLMEIREGEAVIRQDDIDCDVFLILKGRAEVTLAEPDSGKDRVLNQLERGDLFGEMSFVTKEPRSATVKALDDLDLLRIDDPALDRIHQRHPRIAAKIFYNFSRLLSERLKRTTRGN